MKRIYGTLICRLKKINGETLTETLLAVLVAALAMVMLATMIVSSVRITGNSAEADEKYYEANNALAGALSDYGTPTASGSVKIKAEDAGTPPFGNETVNVEYFVNDDAGKTQIVSFRKVQTAP